MILITGAAGYIGSHTCVELLNKGYDIVAFDDLSNSSVEAIRRVEKITGKSIRFYEADMLDQAAMDKIFAENAIDAVIHFAGLKAVGESVHQPLRYYRTNVQGTLNLLDAMEKAGVRRMIFSSSATVYGSKNPSPYQEDMPTARCASPYGQTKVTIENILEDLSTSDPRWSISLLRYFNPVGAHESGLIGEDPTGVPANLCPFIAQVAVGRRAELVVHGNDYNTPDGTNQRDYIHVVDLALGHVAALERAMHHTGVEIFNLGSGIPISVLEFVDAFSKACEKDIPYTIGPRRAGDLDAFYADSSRAEKVLGWKAQLDILRMCADTWRWQQMNPDGYGA